MPIGGPYHAPHLYSRNVVDELISPDCAAVMNHFHARQPIFSSTASFFVPGMSTVDLISQALAEVLMEQVHWDNAVQSLISSLAPSDTYCRILAIGSMTLGNSLASSLKAYHVDTSLDDYSSWTSCDSEQLSTSRSRISESKIAIIGMAGRYPNAANNEKLWEILEDGLDVHRKVRSLSHS